MDFLKRVLNGVWNVVRVLWIVMLIGGFVELSKMGSESNKYVLLVGYLIFIGLTLLYVAMEVFIFGMKRKCPRCRKLFALKWSGNEYVDSKQVSVLAEVNTYNRNHEKIGTQEQYVAGTRRYYHKNYTCKCCGKKYYITYSKVSKNL